MGLTHGDPSLVRGGNVVNFIFLYCLGQYIRTVENKLDAIRLRTIVTLFLFLNIFVVTLITLHYSVIVNLVMTQLFFTYCSAGLIFNAVLFFEIFRRMHFQSKAINRIAGCTFSMYLFHHQHFILYTVIGSVVVYICSKGFSTSVELLLFSLLTIVVMLFTVLIDQPIKKLLQKLEAKILRTTAMFKISDFIEEKQSL